MLTDHDIYKNLTAVRPDRVTKTFNKINRSYTLSYSTGLYLANCMRLANGTYRIDVNRREFFRNSYRPYKQITGDRARKIYTYAKEYCR